MSRKGNCLDNALMENFFGLLKQEMFYGNQFQHFDQLKQAIHPVSYTHLRAHET